MSEKTARSAARRAPPCGTWSNVRGRGSARAASRAVRTRPTPTRESPCLFCQKARASLIDADGAICPECIELARQIIVEASPGLPPARVVKR